MTPGQRVDREITRRCVIGPRSRVAGADEVDGEDHGSAGKQQHNPSRPISVVSSRHDHYTTPRTGDSAGL
jgi:hypothetical protein